MTPEELAERMAAVMDAESLKVIVREFNKALERVLVPLSEAGELHPTETDSVLDRPTERVPSGGWLTAGYLRQVQQRVTESIAAENWLDGAKFVISLLLTLRGL